MQNKNYLCIRQDLLENFAEFDPVSLKVLVYLLHETFYKEGYYSPSKLNISLAARECGLSRQSVYTAISKLEKKGYITKEGERIIYCPPNGHVHKIDTKCPQDRQSPVHKIDTTVNKMDTTCPPNGQSTPLKPRTEKRLEVPVISSSILNNKTNIIEGRNVCLDRIINWEKDPEFLKIRSKSEHKAMPKFEMNPESRKLLEWLAKETEGDTASTRFLEKYQLDLFKYALIIAKSPIAYWIKKMTDFMQNASIVTIPDDYVKASPEELQENWIERQKRTAEITKRNTEKYTKQKEESDKYYNDMDRAVDDLEKNDPGQFEILREEAFLNTKSKMPYVHEPSTHSMFNRSVRSLIFNQINGVTK